MSATPTKTIRPFTFDQSFDILFEPELEVKKEEEEVVPTFSEEELQAAREEAYKLGVEAGQQEIRSSLEQQVAATLEIVSSTLGRVQELQTASNEHIARDLIDVAVAAMRKLLPSTIERHGTAEVEELVSDTLSKVLDEPRVTIRVSDKVAGDIEQRLRDIASRIGFAGEVRVEPDDGLGPADCRIVWSDGEALRKLETILEDLGGLVGGLPREPYEEETLAPAPPPDEAPNGDAQDGGEPMDVVVDLTAEPEAASGAEPEPAEAPEPMPDVATQETAAEVDAPPAADGEDAATEAAETELAEPEMPAEAASDVAPPLTETPVDGEEAAEQDDEGSDAGRDPTPGPG